MVYVAVGLVRLARRKVTQRRSSCRCVVALLIVITLGCSSSGGETGLLGCYDSALGRTRDVTQIFGHGVAEVHDAYAEYLTADAAARESARAYDAAVEALASDQPAALVAELAEFDNARRNADTAHVIYRRAGPA